MRGPLLLALLLLLAAPARSADRMALLPFALENTSLEPDRPDELARIVMLDEVAVARLEEAGYELVDTAPVAEEVGALSSIRGCNGCEIALGRKLGASQVAFGWVQKVSNLILNINMVVRDVGSGRLLAAGSVDIRGNTEESWRRGVVYLLDRRIVPALDR
jgi:hypothetical protein